MYIRNRSKVSKKNDQYNFENHKRQHFSCRFSETFSNVDTISQCRYSIECDRILIWQNCTALVGGQQRSAALTDQYEASDAKCCRCWPTCAYLKYFDPPLCHNSDNISAACFAASEFDMAYSFMNETVIEANKSRTLLR